MNQIIVGLIGGSIVSLISFILGLFGNIWYARYQENRQRQNEALKKHSADLAERFIKRTSEFLANISNREGMLTYTNVDAQYSIDATQTSWPIDYVNQDFICFKEHFPTEVSEISGLKEQLVTSNANNKSFNKDLGNLLEEKSRIPVKNYFKRINIAPPFFEAGILSFLRLSYREIAQKESGYREEDDFVFNFQQSECVPEDQKGDFWLVQLKGRKLAKVKNNDEAELCKNALVELMENSELQVKGQSLYTEAERLKNKAQNLSRSLDLVCELFDKYGKLLKRKRSCPVCKLIFE